MFNKSIIWLAALSPSFPRGLFKTMLWTLVVLAVFGPLAAVALPFVEFFNDMAAQDKGKSQGTYGRTYGEAEKPVYREPPAGTLPRQVYPRQLKGRKEEDLARSGRGLVNPVPRTMVSMRRGQQLFNTYCITCHGPRGEADGPVVGPDRFPAPTSLHDARVRQGGDGRIFHAITLGTGQMQGYADKVTPRERWDLVNFIRALQRANNPKSEDFKK